MESEATVRRWVDGPLDRDVEAAIERLARSEGVRRVAVMPDVHLSADVCIGTVVGTDGPLYPNAVGGDIGCGVAALAFDADAGRRVMAAAACDVVRAALGVDADESLWVSCHHNHVRRESHGGETLWVHRKGAIPGAAGEPGVVPGSMGTRSYHVEGRGCAEAMASSAHGAGRRMSRTEARRALSAKDVTRELRGVWFDRRLAAGLRDEAPSAYKDVDAVLRAERELVRVVRRLRPLLCFKGV
jgi:RNA-splicing ligase RtcB